MRKNRVLYFADYCLSPFEKIPNVGILCEGDTILSVGGASAFAQNEEGLKVVHMDGCYAVPGFIDSHIHGLNQQDASLVNEFDDAIWNMFRELLKHGVTTFIPTIVSLPRDILLKTVKKLGQILCQPKIRDAAPFMHVEGPFISMQKRGSQDANGISEIDLDYAKELIDAGNGKIKLMTFAPELEHSGELIDLMIQNGVIPSMGHSMADANQTRRAIERGCRRCTYIFNCMPPLENRKSTLTDVALTDDSVQVEVISDGVHIHPGIVDLTVRCKPRDKVIGISNAVSCLTPYDRDRYIANTRGVGILNDGREINDSGSSYVQTANGLIAGATMTLDHSWFHLMNYTKMEPTLAAACFTMNPARDLGLYSRGEIRPGKAADIVFFDSEKDTVRATVNSGELVYPEENEEN